MSIFHLRYSVWVSYSPIPISHHIYPIPMQRIAIQSIFVIPIDSTCSQLVLDSVWGVDNLSCTEDFYCSFIATRNNCLARRQTLRPPILLFGHIVQQNGIVLFALADESFSSLLSPHSHKSQVQFSNVHSSSMYICANNTQRNQKWIGSRQFANSHLTHSVLLTKQKIPFQPNPNRI